MITKEKTVQNAEDDGRDEIDVLKSEQGNGRDGALVESAETLVVEEEAQTEIGDRFRQLRERIMNKRINDEILNQQAETEPPSSTERLESKGDGPQLLKTITSKTSNAKQSDISDRIRQIREALNKKSAGQDKAATRVENDSIVKPRINEKREDYPKAMQRSNDVKIEVLPIIQDNVALRFGNEELRALRQEIEPTQTRSQRTQRHLVGAIRGVPKQPQIEE